MSELDGTDLVDWRQLPPDQRRGWWEQLWEAAIAISDRYRLALRSRWWQDAVQVEALAAFCGWLRLYDTGAYNDPPGKLQLLWELERLRAVLRAGEQAFEPSRDRLAFDRHLASIERPPDRSSTDDHAEATQAVLITKRQYQADELGAVLDRLEELRDRESVLQATLSDRQGHPDRGLAERDLAEVRATLRVLLRRKHALRQQLEDRSDS